MSTIKHEDIHCGRLTRDEIMWAINDNNWQAFRKSLKGIDTATKINELRRWLIEEQHSYKAQVQVTNYLNALRRGGLL